MHTIQTFILRLLIDPESPDSLQGSIQSISGNERQSFCSAKALIDLLQQATESVTEEKDEK